MNHKVSGYDGICCECFCPVITGEGVRLREKGRMFHKSCLEQKPNGYYIKIERRKAEREETVVDS